MRKIQRLGKREATSGVEFLQLLFKDPLVTASFIASEMGFSRVGSQKLIERFVELDILKAIDETAKYGRTYYYKKYVDLFNN